MALVSPVPSSKTSFGTLAAPTLFSCHRGIVGVATDNPTDPLDYFWLNAGDSLQLPTGVTVHYRAGQDNSVLHTMPAGV